MPSILEFADMAKLPIRLYSSSYNKFVFVSERVKAGDHVVEAHPQQDSRENLHLMRVEENKYRLSSWNYDGRVLFVSEDTKGGDNLIEAHYGGDQEREIFTFMQAGSPFQYKLYQPDYGKYVFVSNDTDFDDNYVEAHSTENDERNVFIVSVGELDWTIKQDPNGMVYENLKEQIEKLRSEGKIDEVDIIVNREWTNLDGVTISETIEQAVSKESTFTWGFSSTLMMGISIKAEFKASEFASISSEFKVEQTIEENREWSTTETVEYRTSQTISCDKAGKYYINAWVDFARDLEVSYYMLFNISAKGKGNPIPSDLLLAGLKVWGFNGTVVRTDPYQLQVRINGKFRGSYGIKTNVVVTKDPDLRKKTLGNNT